MPHSKNILEISKLTVAYQQANSSLVALRDFSINIAEGQIYGLVGESGSGKSTLALAIMRYLGKEGAIRSGRIMLGELEITKLNESDLQELRGSDISYVPQNPFTSLNPSMLIEDQLSESLRLHGKSDQKDANQEVLDLMRKVRLPDPERIAKSYPHQLSGGMQQRVMIAMALSSEPKLLVLDEPTTSLDVTTEAAILDLIRELNAKESTSTLYVTHNLGIIAGIADRVAVIYASELMEDAPTDDLFAQALHPYTLGLLESVPRLGQRKNEKTIQGIDGQIPSLNDLPSACVFAPRCPLAIELCWQKRPDLEEVSVAHHVRCHRWLEIKTGEIDPLQSEKPTATINKQALQELLKLSHVDVRYPIRRSVPDLIRRNPEREVKAVSNFSLKIASSETIGLVGESGSGKSSLARAIIGLVEPSSGEIKLMNIALPKSLANRDRSLLSTLQMIFQHPEEALNPYLSVGESLQRPLQTLLGMSRSDAKKRASELLSLVRIPQELANRLPAQLSGGEKQRIAIARAFASHPNLLLADEALSSLDVSVQATILNLLSELQMEHDSAMIFISHDIAVVSYIADRIAVMYLGQIMQLSSSENFFSPPYHPYTEALLSALPPPDPKVVRKRILLDGEIPSARDLPSGCPFHTRCPRNLGDICKNEMPPLQNSVDGSQILCHIPIQELKQIQDPVMVFDPADEGISDQ